MDTHETGDVAKSWRIITPSSVDTHQMSNLSALPPELRERAITRRILGTDRFIRRDQFLALLDLLSSIGVIPRGLANVFLSEMSMRYGLIAAHGHPVFAVLPDILEDEASALRLD